MLFRQDAFRPREIHNRARRGGLVVGAEGLPDIVGHHGEELVLTVQNVGRRSTPLEVETSTTS